MSEEVYRRRSTDASPIGGLNNADADAINYRRHAGTINAGVCPPRVQSARGARALNNKNKLYLYIYVKL